MKRSNAWDWRVLNETWLAWFHHGPMLSSEHNEAYQVAITAYSYRNHQYELFFKGIYWTCRKNEQMVFIFFFFFFFATRVLVTIESSGCGQFIPAVLFETRLVDGGINLWNRQYTLVMPIVSVSSFAFFSRWRHWSNECFITIGNRNDTLGRVLTQRANAFSLS